MITREVCSMTYEKACEAKYLVNVLGLTQTQAAIIIGVNVGDVSRVIRGLRFADAEPVPPADAA